MPIPYHVAFWNLENLFDVENSPRRGEKLQRAIGRDLVGWSQFQLDGKVSQLAAIIRQLNGGQGPDILGVCEVENAFVLGLLVQALALPGRNYLVAHHDMSDQRGIDVAFIYDANFFTFEAQFNHFVMRRTATRDILQVNFRTTQNRLFVAIANHWPSRSGGALESAPYRATAGETLAYFHHRILEVHGDDTPVLAMGDFNDEPPDASLVNHALSTRDPRKVLNAEISRLHNLMWPLLGQGLGSFYFQGFANLLDQFLANKNLLRDISPIRVLPETVEIVRRPGTFKLASDYPAPIPYGGMGKPINPSGFSDHFPITVNVIEAG